MTIRVGNLHDDVLMEVFDFYRQSFQDGSERVWNSKKGWFKLAHVCHNWRTVVLASPSRLRLRLYLTSVTPTRAAVLQYLSHLPIVVDFSNVAWDASTLKCLISALKYPDRVRRIEVQGSHIYEQTERISKALDRSFPALESLRIINFGDPDPPILLSSHFMASIHSLRRLQLDDQFSRSVSLEVLSATTSLVDLTLNVATIFSLNGASIFTHLQRLSHLRNLQVFSRCGWGDETPHTTTTLLAELTYFSLSAGYSEIEWFVAGLVAPSLRELHTSIYDTSDILHPNVSEFISAAGIVFFAAQLAISHRTHQTSLFAHPLSIDGPPSKIVMIEGKSFEPTSSPIVATVEDIFLSLPDPIELVFQVDFDFAPLVKSFRNVKVLRLHHGLEDEVADMLGQPTEHPLPAQLIDPGGTTPFGTPINSRRSSLDTFPLLEEIVVYPIMPISKKECVSVLESFGPFATARQQDGRPVKVFWDPDGKVPRHFRTDSVKYSSGC